MKEYLRKELSATGVPVTDFGVHSVQSADYPDIAHPLAAEVVSGRARFGILICGTGNGMAMTANKHRGIRAALCWNAEIAGLARLHNDANVLVLPGRFVTEEEALRAVKVFLETAFEGGRHTLRIDKIDRDIQ